MTAPESGAIAPEQSTRQSPGESPEQSTRQSPGDEAATTAEVVDVEESEAPRRWRLVAGRVVTAAAALLVLLALTVPNQISHFTPAAFIRIPVEGLLAVALVLVLPPRPRRVAAACVGFVLGVLLIAKMFDMGFFSALARPFNPVFDLPLLTAAVGFLTESIGRLGAIAVVVAAVLLALGLVALLILSALRLTRPLVEHRTPAAGTVAVLGVAWVTCALLGVQIVPGVPVAAHDYDRVARVSTSLQDKQAFAAEAAFDAFENTPGEQLLPALRGKDVVIVFIESYGRDAVEDPEFTPTVGDVLAAGNRRLEAAGYSSQSAFLSAATVGGASWLNHATLLSGLWVNNQQRYRTLVGTDRLTLNSAFQRAGWRTVAVMPGIWEAWPEGEFYGYDQVYDADALGYQGPRMNWGIIPDQYAMSAFEQFERARTDRDPVMAEIALLSSHAPWTPIPPLIDWHAIGADGSGFDNVEQVGPPADQVWPDPARIRTVYGAAIGYSLATMISYVETYGDDDLVFIFLGDHQPAPIVTGEDATRDVPITLVAGDPTVLDHISDWGWHDGLHPGPQAPVWPMNAFRDEFLTAFGSSAASP